MVMQGAVDPKTAHHVLKGKGRKGEACMGIMCVCEMNVGQQGEACMGIMCVLHYITLHYITLHYITLHYITC